MVWVLACDCWGLGFECYLVLSIFPFTCPFLLSFIAKVYSHTSKGCISSRNVKSCFKNGPQPVMKQTQGLLLTTQWNNSKFERLLLLKNMSMSSRPSGSLANSLLTQVLAVALILFLQMLMVTPSTLSITFFVDTRLRRCRRPTLTF